jgi:hypothetical protein
MGEWVDLKFKVCKMQYVCKMYLFLRYDDTSKKLNTCEENLQLTETKLCHSEKILERTIRDKRKMEGDVDVLEKENYALKEAVETSKCSLEEEILLRVDIEHQLQSTKEEMNFKQQMFNKVDCFDSIHTPPPNFFLNSKNLYIIINLYYFQDPTSCGSHQSVG